jgi:ABC-type glycerol-3-phosphate transport system substrate-binding protein
VYKGRGNAADASFPSGECAMITGSSGLYARVAKEAKFAYGISTLPYYPDVKGAPQNTAIGGASLWVMAGKKAEEYKGVADFLNFLNDTKVQAASHQRTGYLPVTMGAYKLTEVRLLQKEPRHRCGRDADDPQDHRQVARHPPGQLRADPRHHRRGNRTNLVRQEDSPRKPWTQP